MSKSSTEPVVEPALSLLAHSSPASPAATTSAAAGAMAGWLVAHVCHENLDHCGSGKAEDELRTIRDRALSLRRDLLALVDRLDDAARAVADAQRASHLPGEMAAERLRALLFASEVPLRSAESCHALLNLAMRALGKVGVRGIAEIGTATALAFAGVVGGSVTARAYLAGIPAGQGIDVTTTRKRAERIFREAEAVRTQITDRVRQHLP